MNIQYVIDNQGNPISVMLPIQFWPQIARSLMIDKLQQDHENSIPTHQDLLETALQRFYALPVSQLGDVPETPSAYQGRVLSLEEMEEAIQAHVSQSI